MYYSNQDICNLIAERETLAQKYHALLFAYNRQYRTERGREFAMHGFLRRLRTLCRCIDRIFTILPPATEDIPTDEAREDATIALQAFIFNVFGCMDNLAWVWVEEKAVRKPDGTALSEAAIGLGVKYHYVRKSFSNKFQAYLQSRKDWFGHLDDYRHALAHRIPLYIPPHLVATKNEEAYSALESQITKASFAGDETLEATLRDQQRALMFFRPIMVHSFSEQSPVVPIHPQVLADFNTVDELAHKMLLELK